jgi:hypothetical protein
LEVRHEVLAWLDGDDPSFLRPDLLEQGEQQLAPLGWLGLEFPEPLESTSSAFARSMPGLAGAPSRCTSSIACADTSSTTRELAHGRLRIPLAHYRRLAIELDRLHHGERQVEDPRRRGLPAARAFVERAAEAIGAARENKHQWRTLRSAILPIEPEVLAACALVEMSARDALGASAVRVMDMSIDSVAGALMGVAENLVEADAEATPEVST